jgi:hypothetical protein
LRSRFNLIELLLNERKLGGSQEAGPFIGEMVGQVFVLVTHNAEALLARSSTPSHIISAPELVAIDGICYLTVAMKTTQAIVPLPIPNQLLICPIYSALGPLASFGAPVWKPFLNRRATPFK